jgi:MSHA biogenesis protein MshJ
VKLDWKSLAARVDDMSLRERAMLFGALSLVVLFLAYVALIDPGLRRQKSLIDRLGRDQHQIAEVRGQLEQLVRSGGAAPRHPDQVAVDALAAKIAEIDAMLAARQSGLVAPERLPALLKDILARTKAVELDSLRVLPGVPVKAGTGDTGLYRHGVEVTVKGSYLDLLRYLEELEKRSSVILWGGVELQVEKYPEVRLRMVIQTLSRNASLLSI